MPQNDVPHAQFTQSHARPVEQRRNALDAVACRNRAQHSGLMAPGSISARGRRPSRMQRLHHASDDVRLTYRLLMADWQRGVLVGTMRQGLIDEQMTRRFGDHGEHAFSCLRRAGRALVGRAFREVNPMPRTSRSLMRRRRSAPVPFIGERTGEQQRSRKRPGRKRERQNHRVVDDFDCASGFGSGRRS